MNTNSTRARQRKLPMGLGLRGVGQTVIYLLLLITPFIYFSHNSTFYQPPDSPPIDAPRRLVLLLVGGILLAMLAWAMAARKRIVWRWHILDIPVLLFAAGGVISSAFSDQPGQSFLNPLWANDSIQLIVIGVLLYFCVKEFLRTREEILRGACALVVACAVMTAVGYVDHIGNALLAMGKLPSFPILLNSGFSSSRLVGTMGNPMITGSYISMIIPLALGLTFAMTGTLRKVMLGVTIFLLPALLLTGARSAWLALFLMLLIMPVIFFLRLQRGEMPAKQRKSLIISGLVALVLLFGVIFAIPSVRSRVTSVAELGSSENTTVKTRIIYMTGAWNMFRARPVTGWGSGRFRIVMPQYRPGGNGAMESGMPIDRGYCTALPHNLPLQTAAEMGLVGLIPAFLIVIVMFVTAWREMRYSSVRSRLAWALFGLLSAYILNNLATFDNAVTMSLFWVGLGLLAGLSARERTVLHLTRETSGAMQAVAVILAAGMLFYVNMNVNASILTHSGVMKIPDEESITAPLAKKAIADCDDGLRLLQQAQDSMMGMGDLAIRESKLSAYRTKNIAASRLNQQEAANARIYKDVHSAYVKANEDVLAIEPRDRFALRFYAIDLFSGNDLVRTEQITSALRTYEPHSAEAHVLYSRYLQMAGKMRKAIAELKLAISIEPTYSDVYILVGRIAYQLYEDGGKDAQIMGQEGVASYRTGIEMGYQLTDGDINYFGLMWTNGRSYPQLLKEFAEIKTITAGNKSAQNNLLIGHFDYLLYRMNKENATVLREEGKRAYASAILQGMEPGGIFMDELDEMWGAGDNEEALQELIAENPGAAAVYVDVLTGHVNYLSYKSSDKARIAGVKAYARALEQNISMRTTFLREFDEMWLLGDYEVELQQLAASEKTTKTYAGSILLGHLNYLVFRKGGKNAEVARTDGFEAYNGLASSGISLPLNYQQEYIEMRPQGGTGTIEAPLGSPF